MEEATGLASCRAVQVPAIWLESEIDLGTCPLNLAVGSAVATVALAVATVALVVATVALVAVTVALVAAETAAVAMVAVAMAFEETAVVVETVVVETVVVVTVVVVTVVVVTEVVVTEVVVTEVVVTEVVVTGAVAATIDQIALAKVVAANNGDPVTIIVPVVIGGRSIIPTVSTTGTTGWIIATTIGQTSTTIGETIGRTIGTIAITGSMATGGTIIRAITGTGLGTGIGGAGPDGDRSALGFPGVGASRFTTTTATTSATRTTWSTMAINRFAAPRTTPCRREAIAQSIPPDIQPAADDWMPLGVFALTQDGQSVSDQPTMFLQLAVSKQGIIAGTFQNTATGVVKSVEGMVDKETQRTAWTAEDQSRPLMETGLSNLTQDTAGVLVHFDNGDTQRWLMARLKQPQGAAASP